MAHLHAQVYRDICGSENHVLCSDVESYNLDATGELQSLEPGGQMNTSP